MIKYAAVPILAILAACSAEVENGEAAEGRAVETLSVNNLIITDPNAVTADTAIETQGSTAQPPQAAPVADSRTAQTTQAEPKQPAIRKPSTGAATKPATTPKPAPAGNSAEPEAPAGTCTAEHRELGHC